MPVTEITDVHSIDQVGPAAVNIAFAAVPLLAIPGLTADVSKRIQDAGGEKISFPHWDTDISAITQNAVRNSRTGVTPSKIELKKYDETALAKVISIDADRYAIADSSEDAMAHIALIVGKEFGKVIQTNLIAQAVHATLGTDLSHDISAVASPGNHMSVDAILDARLKWEEHASELPPVCLMRTAQFNQLAKSSDYKTLAAGGQSTLVKQSDQWGQADFPFVGFVHGVPLVLCDSLPTATGPVKHTALLVSLACFGAFVGNQPQTEIISHAGSTVKTIDTHFRFATTLFKHKPRRCVKLITGV